MIANWFANVPFAINFESNRALDDEEKHTTRESTSSSAAARSRFRCGSCMALSDQRPVRAVEALVTALPRARLTVLHGVGHLDGYIAAPGDDMDWVFDVFGGRPITLEKALVADSGGLTDITFRVVK